MPTSPYSNAPPRLSGRILLLILVLLAPVAAASAEGTEKHILVLQSGTSSIYQSVSQAVTNQLRDYCSMAPENCRVSYKLESAVLDDKAALAKAITAADLIITLGRQASLEVSGLRPSAPTLFTLIPQDTTSAIASCCSHDDQVALVLDQPLERQLELIRAALPGHRRVGLLLSKADDERLPRLRQLAESRGLELIIAHANDPDRLGPALNELLEGIDLLLALPDPAVYNKNTIVSILLSSYRQRVPVVGFSGPYVRAGALIALHSTPEQIGRQIAEALGHRLVHGRWPRTGIQPPQYFDVAINTRVARSLGIRITQPQALLRRLRENGK